MEIVMNFAITCRHFLRHFDTKILKKYLLCLDMYNDYWIFPVFFFRIFFDFGPFDSGDDKR